MKRKIDALKIAYQTEIDGFEFYKKSAKKCKNRLGRVIFDSLAKEEQNHIKRIKKIWDSLEKGKSWGETPLPDKIAKYMPVNFETIFKKAEKKIKKNEEVDADDTKAIKLAMKLETDGYKFYEKQEKKADGEYEKKFYQQLCSEESEHYRILEETYEYLTNPSDWFSKKERPIYEG